METKRKAKNYFIRHKPRDSEGYAWTNHVAEKMKHYQLSAQIVKRIIRNPKRVEEGVAPGTVAVMQPRGKKRVTEIWAMYQDIKVKGKSKKRIITAWRYPGVSPVREKIPIPEDIREELESIL